MPLAEGPPPSHDVLPRPPRALDGAGSIGERWQCSEETGPPVQLQRLADGCGRGADPRGEGREAVVERTPEEHTSEHSNFECGPSERGGNTGSSWDGRGVQPALR